MNPPPADDSLRHTQVAPAFAHRTTISASIPANFLESTRPRLAAAALLYALGTTVSILQTILVDVLMAHEPAKFEKGYALAILFVLISIAVCGLTRSKRLHPRTLHALGMAYGVIASLGIGLGVTSIPFSTEIPESIHNWGVSWLCVWVIVFPLIVPTTPRRAAVVAFASGVMEPIGMLFWVLAFDYPLPSTHTLAAMWLPILICAALATLEARLIYGMGRELERAKQLGSYELVELLGRGGMGEVWRAHHRMLARPAAIKLVRAEVLGDGEQAAQALRRFEREAQATAALTSPHSIALYDFGLTQDGAFYYVMELLDGLNLDVLVQRFGPLPAERALHVLRQACLSLADAHHHGLIHRDIKPANIYACRMGLEYDFIKVLDFGLVKRSRAGDRMATALTGEMALTGTPAYISPEAALGHAIDARADLYALGCVGYWLLTGRLVFDGKTAMEVVTHHARTPPTPPSQRTELPLPAGLDAAILWCLEKDPSARPADAGALGASLDAIAPAAAWTPERARRWWETHFPSPSAPAAAVTAAVTTHRRVIARRATEETPRT